jgi:hypothetical protein
MRLNLGGIGRFFGLGGAAQPSSIAPSEAPAAIKELKDSGQRVALAAELIGTRELSPETLTQIAKELTPVEREQVLDRVPAERRAELELLGFGVPLGEGGASTAADRARLEASALGVPPILAAFVADADFLPRMAKVRAGEPAFAVDEKLELSEQLRRLDQAQLKALREVLVEKPPHPELKKMRGHPALKGPPTVQGILQILGGEPLGKKPAPSPELERRARETIDLIGQNLSPEERNRWVAIVGQSEAAVSLLVRHGPAALHAVNALGIQGVEAAGHAWVEGHAMIEAGLAHPGGFPALKAHLDRVGPEGFGATMHALSLLHWNGPSVHRALRVLDLEQAAALGLLLAKDGHGFRALKHLQGGEGAALAALKGKSPKAMEQLLAAASAKIPEFGAGDAPLYGGAKWPDADPQRTTKVISAEAQVEQATGLSLHQRHELDEQQLGTVSRHLKSRVGQVQGTLGEMLERELLGRRFVSPKYYDELYAKGVKNPEHRYSVETFEAWKQAELVVREAAHQSRGRPLQEGELIAVMRHAHALAGQGMLATYETHMKPEDLGRLRSKPEDHVQLGNQLIEMERDVSSRLDQNPYLSDEQIRFERGSEPGKIARSVHFAKGPDVPQFMGELDRWVRDNEGKIPPAELAAEVHFRLVSIHPFMDGNGRTAKLMADFLLMRAGAEPPLWRKGDVMKNQPEWPDAVREGLLFELATVERYFRVAVENAPSPNPPEQRRRW